MTSSNEYKGYIYIKRNKGYMKIEQFHNVHENERLFILATGPSLKTVPFNKLENEYTMAIGSVNLLYDEINWRPDYFVSWDFSCEEYMTAVVPGDASHQERVKQVEDHLESDTILFLSNAAKKYFGNNSQIYYYNWKKIIPPFKSIQAGTYNNWERIRKLDEDEIEPDIYFSNDITEVIYNFGGTISTTPQIANYMGFSEMYYLGVDLYEDNRPYLLFPSAGDPNEYVNSSSTIKNYLQLVQDGKPTRATLNAIAFKIYREIIPESILTDKNHFAEDYSPKTVINAEKANKNGNKIHNMIQKAAKNCDFSVYNATPGGYLETYDRVDLNEVLD